MNRWTKMLPLAAILALPLAAQTGQPAPSKAKISKADAQKIALAKEPGNVVSSGLENEHSKLIFSFDIRTKMELREVHVDAKTGAIVEDSVESAADEAKEAAQEKMVQKKPSPPNN
jgi:hypothetical protein